LTQWSRLSWLITGASSGFGLELAKAVLAAGGRVAAATRDPTRLADLAAQHEGRLFPVAMDVGDGASIRTAAAQVAATFGPVDVLVNNAGYSLVGAIEEVDEAEYRPVLELNFFGVVALTRLLLPGMRARRRGFVVNFSSVSGVVGPPGSGFYAAAKFAVEGWSDSLRAEGAPLGIGVMVVEPGPFRTEFFGEKRLYPAREIADYVNVRARRERPAEQPGAQPGDPARGAAVIIEAMQSAAPPARLPLGSIAADLIPQIYRDRIAEAEAWADRSRQADFVGRTPST